MADNEVSKITWIAIVVALAGSVYGVTKIQIPALAESVFAKVSNLVEMGDTNNAGSETAPVAEKPDGNDAKWVEKGNYGTNALDPQQPVIAPATAIFTKGSTQLTSLKFLDKTILPKDSNGYFSNNSKLTTFETKNLDTANVTNMSGMFYNMSALTALDVSKFDTSKVTNMSEMFYNTQSLTALDVSNFNTSNVTDMKYMFANMKALKTLDVSNFDMTKVTDQSYMFDNTPAVITPKLG